MNRIVAGSAAPGSDPIVSFYRGGRDAVGRTLVDILSWDDDWLEGIHDYIQWVFPTRQPSAVNPDAPLVSDQTATAFAADPALRNALLRTLDRMLTFYGLRRLIDETGSRIEIDPTHFADRARTWVHPGNHNHLRLTRIMQSLCALGSRDEASALQRCLLDIAAGPGASLVTPTTVRFWKDAV